MRAHLTCLAALAMMTTSCIPVIPECDKGPAGFPDFEYLDRSVECALPLPGPCLIGAEGCPCTAGGGCDPGLMCEMAVCVSEAGDGDGDGDSGPGDGDGDGDGEPAACGYPDGPYGFHVGDVFENLVLFDCQGNQVQIAQYLPQEGRPDIETRGVVFAVAALWCDPCRMEGEGYANEFFDEYAPQGIQFIQSLDEGAAGAAVVPSSCAGWSSTVAKDKFPILYVDKVASLRAKIELMPNEPIPFTLIFNANGIITYRQTGGVVDSDVLKQQMDYLLNDPYGN